MKKSAYKLIYGYMALTYAVLFLGVLISDTLYTGQSRILCASSVPRLFVPGIMNVPTAVFWILFGLMIAVTVVCARVFKQFTLGIGITNGLLGLFSLIVYGSELKKFIPFTVNMPTVRSAFFIIGSYVIVILTLIFVPLIVFSKDSDEFDRIW